MQAIDKPFLQFLEGVDKRFSIPVYQSKEGIGVKA
jgi:hypothetical protein